MNFRTLLLFTIIGASTFTVNAQTKGTLRQNSAPEFQQCFTNYLKYNSNRKLEGYRVQVFNGNRREANDWRSKFIAVFPELESMVIFETPDYKLQVGNYKSLFDAEGTLSLIRTQFPGAFIVSTHINPPTLKLPQPISTSEEVVEEVKTEE